MGCRFGFPTEFQFWVELHGPWELRSVSGSRAVWFSQSPGEHLQLHPSETALLPMAGVGHGPHHSPHLVEALNKGLLLKHGIWQVPL